MSGYRFDEMTGGWVVIAAARRGVPMLTRDAPAPPEAAVSAAARCPFCPGRESETETTLAAMNDKDGAWRVRVVRNRYPTVTPDASLHASVQGGTALPAAGSHEVVIESREHDIDWHEFAPSLATDVTRMYRDRMRALEVEPGVRAVALFRNRGRRAGSSQPHPHAQLVATHVIPPFTELRRSVAVRHAETTNTSLLDSVVARELAAALRVVEATDRFVVLCPFAPHRSYETWIVPRSSGQSFAAVSDDALPAFAAVVQRSIARVLDVTGGAAYNLLFRTPPVGTPSGNSAFWYLEIAPRTGGDAGFEISTGMDVVPVTPEAAAEAMRAVVIQREGNSSRQ